MNLKLERLTAEAKLPTRDHPLDAGLDLYSVVTVQIPARGQQVVNTGIKINDSPDDVVYFIWPRGGLDAMFGLHVGAGVVDCNYRGEIKVLLKNMSDQPLLISRGDSIAQMVCVPVLYPIPIEDNDEVVTDRGTAGGINND
jgi:dUTP pyrophosphatase